MGKTYTIGNISHGLVYAILDNGHLELKVFKTDEVPDASWWVQIHTERSI
jgi:hypothetical protein